MGVLDELCRAVAADGGAALYLDDGDGALQRGRPRQAPAAMRAPRLLDQLRYEGHDRRTLVLTRARHAERGGRC